MSAPSPDHAEPVPADAAGTAAAGDAGRAGVHRLLLTFLVCMVPGLVVADLWVGWLDESEREETDDNYWLPDDKLGWRPRPGFENPEFGTVLSTLGMRNPEIPADAPADEVRILGCGASRTYGAGGAHQSEIWNNELQRALDGEETGSFRVLNGGVMAYSLVQSCRRAIELIDEVAPDVVFIETTPGAQMLLDPSKARRFVYVGDELVERDVVEGWPDALQSAVVSVHKLLLHSNLYLRHRAKFSVENEDRPSDIQKWVLSDEEQSDYVTGMLERTFGELDQLARAARENGVELRMMIYPEHYQDSEERWGTFLVDNQSSGAPPIGTDRLEGVGLLKDKCRELGVEFWDFTDEITRFGGAPGRYLNDQGHWSGAGHAVVAEGLLARLRSEGLLEELVASRRTRPR